MTLQAPKREEVVRARRISLIPAETSFFFSRILRHCALFEFGTTQRHSTYRSYPRGYLGLRFTAVSTLLDEIMKWILTRIVLGVTRSNRMITRGVAWLFLIFFCGSYHVFRVINSSFGYCVSLIPLLKSNQTHFIFTQPNIRSWIDFISDLSCWCFSQPIAMLTLLLFVIH